MSPARGEGRPVLSVEELAERWSVNVKTIHEAIRLGQLRVMRIGKRVIRIPLVEVLNHEQGRVAPTGGAHVGEA